MTIMNQLAKLASDFGWKLQAPEVGIFVMESFVFGNSPPTEEERRCFDSLVQMHKAGQCLGIQEWDSTIRLLWNTETGWSTYKFLLDQLFSVIQSHHDALYFRACYEELESSTPEIGDTDGWCARGDDLLERDGQFRASKKSSGAALEGVLLNAARKSGGSQEELLKLVLSLSGKALLERIKNRAGRPNARPIRATSTNVPDILEHTVATVEQHGSGVLIWLKQTHRAENAWKAFGHLFRRNAPVKKASRL